MQKCLVWLGNPAPYREWLHSRSWCDYPNSIWSLGRTEWENWCPLFTQHVSSQWRERGKQKTFDKSTTQPASQPACQSSHYFFVSQWRILASAIWLVAINRHFLFSQMTGFQLKYHPQRRWCWCDEFGLVWKKKKKTNLKLLPPFRQTLTVYLLWLADCLVYNLIAQWI